MRRLIGIALVLACAQPGPPPGGPPDRVPPFVVQVSPDTNALNVRGNSITFEFSEVVSERPQGIPSLDQAFIVSPSTGPVGVSWRRSRIEVTPRGGLRPNTTYTVQLLPGLVDLASNMDSSGATVVFSTGPAISTGAITGRVFDWAAARPAANARVEAITLPDSASYAATSDSLGEFAIRNLPPGTYLLRALIDQNRNRFVDPRELFDTVTVALADSFQREMLAAIRDSLGPGLVTAEARDSLWIRMTFDRPIDTAFVPQPSLVSVKRADSTVVPVLEVITQAMMDQRIADTARVRAIEDSVRRAAAADSARVADSTAAAAAGAQPPRPTGRRPGAPTRPPIVEAPDTTQREAPRPTARIPGTILYARVDAALVAGTAHRVRVQDVVSVTGATRTSERVFTTARPAARPDTGSRSRD